MYKAEENAELEFSFPDDLRWYELDKQGVRLPVKMSFVDLVIEREDDILLVEIKDPSNTNSRPIEQKKFFKKLLDNSILAHELTPKARGSYSFLHLMMRDKKPLKFVFLVGLDAFDPEQQKAVLFGFKDRLLANIYCEAYEAWKLKYIDDCAVLSVENWNVRFPEWPIVRLK